MRPDDIILICGKIRSGKSYFLKNRILRGLELNRRRYIIWDYNHEHTPPRRTGVSIYHLKDIITRFNSGTPHIVFRPLDKSDEAFDLFCTTVWQLNNITLIIEEVERYATSYACPPHLKQLIDTGRHKGIGIYCTSRRPQRLTNDIPSNANHLFMFKQHLPRDIDYLSQWVGEGVYALPKLKEYQFMHFNAVTGQLTTHRKV